MKEEYGLFVWPCSIILAEYVWQQKSRFTSASVVEVMNLNLLYSITCSFCYWKFYDFVANWCWSLAVFVAYFAYCVLVLVWLVFYLLLIHHMVYSLGQGPRCLGWLLQKWVQMWRWLTIQTDQRSDFVTSFSVDTELRLHYLIIALETVF